MKKKPENIQSVELSPEDISQVVGGAEQRVAFLLDPLLQRARQTGDRRLEESVNQQAYHLNTTLQKAGVPQVSLDQASAIRERHTRRAKEVSKRGWIGEGPLT